MIKQIYVCECDICGAVEKAKPTSYRNETDYTIPEGWTHGANKDVCICSKCSQKLKKTSTLTLNSCSESVPVYGCPVTIGAGIQLDANTPICK